MDGEAEDEKEQESSLEEESEQNDDDVEPEPEGPLDPRVIIEDDDGAVELVGAAAVEELDSLRDVLDKEDASLDRPDGADSDPEEHPEADLFHDFIYEEEPVPLTYEETRGKTTFVHHKESKQLLGKITYWMGGISCVCHIPEHKKKCKNFVIAPHDFLNGNIFSEWLMAGYGSPRPSRLILV